MVRARRRRRRCCYCHRLFQPNPHVKDRQKACSDPACQQKRKDEGQSNWLSKPANREYFAGRYGYLKAWLEKPKNLGYLRRYRQKQRAGRAATPATRPRPSRSTRSASREPGLATEATLNR